MMARDGQVEYDGEEVPKVVVAERSSSSPYSRSDIEDSRCPLDGVLGKDQLSRSVLKDIPCPLDGFAGERSTSERRVAGLSAANGPQEHRS